MDLITSTALAFMEKAGGEVNAAKDAWKTRMQHDQALAERLTPLLVEMAINAACDGVWRSYRKARWSGEAAAATIGYVEVEDGGESREPDVVVTTTHDQPRADTRPRTLQKGETSPPSAKLLRGMEMALSGHLAYEMPDGTRLGDWRKPELVAHGRTMVKQGRTTMINGYWLIAIGEALPNAMCRVRDELSHAYLERLRRDQEYIRKAARDEEPEMV